MLMTCNYMNDQENKIKMAIILIMICLNRIYRLSKIFLHLNGKKLEKLTFTYTKHLLIRAVKNMRNIHTIGKLVLVNIL